MWPFTSRRIMGNRWWALGFIVFVCWQAVDFVSDAPGSTNSADANSQAAEDLQRRAVGDAINAM